jgi:hypothetical protein
MCKKRERDVAENLRKLKLAQGESIPIVVASRSDSSAECIKSDDAHISRVVKDILPKEANTLVQLRNFAYDETIEEMQRRRISAPPSFEDKFGKLPAGYVKKKAEKKHEVEKERKWRASLKTDKN